MRDWKRELAQICQFLTMKVLVTPEMNDINWTHSHGPFFGPMPDSPDVLGWTLSCQACHLHDKSASQAVLAPDYAVSLFYILLTDILWLGPSSY
jgi:hypothetical protein